MNWFLFQNVGDDNWRPVWGTWLTGLGGGAIIYAIYFAPPALLMYVAIRRMRRGQREYRALASWSVWFLVMIGVSILAHLLPRHSVAWLVVFIGTAVAGCGWLLYGIRLPIWRRAGQSREVTS